MESEYATAFSVLCGKRVPDAGPEPDLVRIGIGGTADSMNDIEVVQEAGIGVAMGNAVDALKKVADYVTAPIGEDGIYKACEHLRLF